MALHQTQANSRDFDANKGFNQLLAKPPAWSFTPKDPIANLVSVGNNQFMQQCADCHSGRLPIAYKTGTVSNNLADYHDVNTLSLTSSDLYFDDDQSRRKLPQSP